MICYTSAQYSITKLIIIISATNIQNRTKLKMISRQVYGLKKLHAWQPSQRVVLELISTRDNIHKSSTWRVISTLENQASSSSRNIRQYKINPLNINISSSNSILVAQLPQRTFTFAIDRDMTEVNTQIEDSQEKQEDSSTLKERDRLLEQFPKDLEARGVEAIITYLSDSLPSFGQKLNDRDNFLLLKHLSYCVCNNVLKCTEAKQAQEVLTALLGSLDNFERDPDKCSPTYHVKLQLINKNEAAIADLSKSQQSTQQNGLDNNKGPSGSNLHALLDCLDRVHINELMEQVLQLEAQKITRDAKKGKKIGRYNNIGYITEGLLSRSLQMMKQSVQKCTDPLTDADMNNILKDIEQITKWIDTHMDPIMKPAQRQSVHEAIVNYLEELNAKIPNTQMTPDLCKSLILMEQKLVDFFMTVELEMMNRAHRNYQQHGMSGNISELAIIEYFNIINCNVTVNLPLGQKVVEGIISGRQSLDYQLDLLRETFKLAFSKPVFQEHLEGLELDEIKNLDKLVALANQKQDFGAMAMMQLAGIEEGTQIDCHDTSSLSPEQKVYLILSSPLGLQALGSKPDLRSEFSGLQRENIIFFMRLLGHGYPEEKRKQVAVLFGSLFNNLNTFCYSWRGIPIYPMIAEKHRVIAELWDIVYENDKKARERMERSILKIDELYVTLKLYGHEIFQHEERYPGKTSRRALEHFLRNNRGFFFKDAGPQAAEALCDLLVNGCKSPFGLENLAILRDKIVLASLTGTQKKLLKSNYSLYKPEHLIHLDSSFYLMFNGAAKYGPKQSTEKNEETHPKIFNKLIRDKFQSADEVAKMTPKDTVSLMSHLILFNQDPIGNLKSRKNKQDQEFQQLLHNILQSNVLENDAVKIMENPPKQLFGPGSQQSQTDDFNIYHGDLMIIKAYLEGKHGLGALDFREGSQFLTTYLDLEKKVIESIKEHHSNWNKLMSKSTSSDQITDYIKQLRTKSIPLVPFMYLYSFFRSQEVIKVMSDSDTALLQSYVRWLVYDENVEAATSSEVVEKARLLSLMKRNVSYKRFMTGVWEEYQR